MVNTDLGKFYMNLIQTSTLWKHSDSTGTSTYSPLEAATDTATTYISIDWPVRQVSWDEFVNRHGNVYIFGNKDQRHNKIKGLSIGAHIIGPSSKNRLTFEVSDGKGSWCSLVVDDVMMTEEMSCHVREERRIKKLEKRENKEQRLRSIRPRVHYSSSGFRRQVNKIKNRGGQTWN